MGIKKLYDQALKGDSKALRSILPDNLDYNTINKKIHNDNSARRRDLYFYGTRMKLLDNGEIPTLHNNISNIDWPTTQGTYSPNDYRQSERSLDLGEYLGATQPLKIDSRPYTAPHRPIPGNVVRVNIPDHKYHGKFGVVILNRQATGEILIRLKHVSVDMFIKYENVEIWEK